MTNKKLLTFLLKCVILYSRKDKTIKKLKKLTGSLMNGGYLSQGFRRSDLIRATLHLTRSVSFKRL